MSLLAALPAKMSAFNSLMQQNACHRNTVNLCRFVAMLLLRNKTNSKTIRSRFFQPTSASKGGDMSELRTHHRMAL